MQYVILFVIVVALLYLSRYFPKVAFSILGVLAVGAGAIVLTTTDIALNSRSRIPVDNIEIENPVITPSYGSGFKFNARLKNLHASEELKESIISITMLDCTDDSAQNCEVVGQTEQRIILQIPPNQARDVERTFTFESVEPRGTVKWNYEVTRTRS